MKARPLISILAALLAPACGVSPAEPPHEPLPVPFVVSDHYSPDGFFGDGEKRGALDLAKECPARAPNAQGDCYTITYKPGIKRFAGIFWQHPHNNWGFWPGHTIAPGATRITFQAKGARGGEAATVGAGQKDTKNPHNDAFRLEEITVAMTDRWTTHEVPFRGETYQGASGVIGAFVLSMAAGDAEGPIVIYLDDIRWAP